MSKKRSYSREFTPADGKGTSYLLPNIPKAFWRSVRAKAKRQGVSLRSLILGMLKRWVDEP